MTYVLDFSLSLGGSKTGLTMAAMIVDISGGDVGSEVTSGFTEIGQGYYLWHYASIPDAHRGGVKFYEDGVAGTILAFVAINPEEAENSDVKSSTLSTFDNTSDQVIVTTNNDKTGYSLSAAGIDAILDEVYEGTRTVREWFRLGAAVLFGKSTGGGTANIKFRDEADTKDRIDATVDGSGNRTGMTLDDS